MGTSIMYQKQGVKLKVGINVLLICCSFFIVQAKSQALVYEPVDLDPELNSQSNPQLVLKKAIKRTSGQYIVSYKGFTVPDNMVIQGFEINYKVELAAESTLNPATTSFDFSFEKPQGDVAFLDTQGGKYNHFKADWFGENIIKITATDNSSGDVAVIYDKVFVDFASRRVMGGDAESLTRSQRDNIARDSINNIQNASKGMAYLPADYSRGDATSDEISKGFYQTTEPRVLKTSTGAILQTTQARRIGSNDAPPGQGIVVSRSTDFGASWGDEILLAQNGDDLWGYTGMIELDGVLYIYADAGHPSHQGSNLIDRGIYTFTSLDDGVTWSQKKRHDQLSDLIGFTSTTIPRGNAITTNLLEVPGLTLDGIEAPAGQGLLLHTYADGYIFASIDGGVKWAKVADSLAYANAATNGYHKAIHLNNEIGWDVIDNADKDIYAVFRRQADTGYKDEYVFSKTMTTGDLGIHFKHIFNQELGNFPAKRAHHDMFKIATGPDQGKFIFSRPGSYSRANPRLAITTEPLAEVVSDMFTEVSLYDGLAWGQSGVVYLEDGLPSTQGMGKDAILLVSESEPMDTSSHQIINLKPDGKGKDERYTTSALILSMDYFNALAGALSKIPGATPGSSGFEAIEGWTGYPKQQQPTAFSSVTDNTGTVWAGAGYIWHHTDATVSHSGSQALALGLDTSGVSQLTITPPTLTDIEEISFYYKSYSDSSTSLTASLEYQMVPDGDWYSLWDGYWSRVSNLQNYTKAVIPVNRFGVYSLRLSVKGLKGLIFDDFIIKPIK